jgi:hypothetical protein
MVALVLAPAWFTTAARLPAIPWAAQAGRPLPSALASWCEPVATPTEAVELIRGDAWEEWSLGNHNAVTLYLHDKHHRRYQDWNRIAHEAKALLMPQESAIRAGLAAVGLPDQVAFDTVQWDVVGALMCAAYLDCRVPTDELRLLDVYEAGHLPVGWETGRRRVLVF